MSNLAHAQRASGASAADQAPRKESELRRTLRLMSRFMTGQRMPFILAFVMLLIEVLSDLGTKYTVPYLLDYLKGGKPDPFTALGLPWALTLVGTVVFLLVGFIVLSMINSSADSAAEIYLARGGRQLGFNMRIALYAHLQRLSLAFYNRQRTGDLLTRVTGDVAAVEDFVVKSLSDMVGGILLLIGSLAFLLWIDLRIGVLALVVVPPLAVVSNYFSGRIKTVAKKVRAREGELATAAQEMLTSIRVIQTYGRGGDQEKRFAAQNDKTLTVALEAARIEALFSFTIKVMESMSTVAVIAVGVWLIQDNLIQLGELVLFYNLIDGMFKPTKKIIKEWNTVGKVYASVERIGELLDRKPAVQDAPNAVAAPPFTGTIEYRNVSFAYQTEPEADEQPAELRLALRNVSFTIDPGEVVALVGSSGAGKSTIVQLLPRLYDPHAGQILIDGHDLREFTLDSLRSRMSMVLQEAILFAGTIAENITYGRENTTREEIIAAAIQANAHEFIEKLPDGYDTLLGERANNLSGGQRQRIAIARAFIRNTSVLILDEPTTGLDAESTDLVLAALRELMRGKATIIISHDLNLIRHADKILTVKQGEIAQVGTHKQLLKAGGLYADLYHKQFGHAVEEQGAQIKPSAAPAPEDDEEPEPVTPQAFQTLMTQALPKPVSPRAFETLLMQMPLPPVPEATQREHVSAAHAAPPAVPVSTLAPAKSHKTSEKHRSAIFETTLLHTIPAPSEPVEPADGHPADGKLSSLISETKAPMLHSEQADQRLNVTQLDPLHSPTLQRELPGLQTAFDGEAMRELLQKVLFGITQPRYQIERCTPGKAIYMGDCCVLRYQIQAKASADGQVLQPLVVGRVFQNQLDCATYIRDKLMPLAMLMRGREEVAPFAMPIALIESLNMVVHVFPIDGELPTLIGATDRERMLEFFAETLPETLDDDFIPRACRIVPVNYARRYRCVLRYELEGVGSDGQPQQRAVYGKVATGNQGAQTGQVIAALRKHILDRRHDHLFSIPRSLGFRPDLQLDLLEAIPGTPCVSQSLKARLSGATERQTGMPTLEQAIDACAEIAAALHTSDIRLGQRRTLDDELTMLQTDIRIVQRITPALGAQFQAWLERIATYAEESDPVRRCFSHGDYTYSQLIFEGSQRGLVDFDTVCQAEPALDLGQFLAYLRVATHKAHKLASSAPTDLGAQLGEQFLQTYIASAGEQIEDAERLRVRASVYEVVSLMRMALHSWQQLKVARLENGIAVLEEQLATLPQLDY
ncbi:MAG TPA: ATP-binding cassette domain-containing protein [Roseiflexaceae bacterium]|nr:ATP-binding cassette domain-containing protein [Roseiflexaceae bacterium]